MGRQLPAKAWCNGSALQPLKLSSPRLHPRLDLRLTLLVFAHARAHLNRPHHRPHHLLQMRWNGRSSTIAASAKQNDILVTSQLLHHEMTLWQDQFTAVPEDCERTM